MGEMRHGIRYVYLCFGDCGLLHLHGDGLVVQRRMHGNSNTHYQLPLTVTYTINYPTSNIHYQLP